MEAQSLVSAINDLLRRLRADLEAQQRFVANAAHQLQTPLAGIQTYVELVKREQSTADSRNLLGHIDRGIDRISHLIRQLLVLAKSEPRDEFAFGEVDLNSVASEASLELIARALEKGIEIAFEGTIDPAIVHGDAGNLKELITNLLENAILYTEGSGIVSVKIEEKNGVQLTVEDNGRGIPEEERTKVFERFYRVLGTHVEGSGLGLAIVKEIAGCTSCHGFT